MKFLLSIVVILMVALICFSNAEPEPEPMADADPEAGVMQMLRKMIPRLMQHGK